MCDLKVEMFDYKTFTNRIKEVRRKAGISQEQMSLEAGLSRYTITAWENEKNVPSVVSLWQFCNTYGVSMDWLCGLEKGEGTCSIPEKSEYGKM